MANESNRKITKHQFQENTTIDGNRIQDAMNDIAERINDVPLVDLRKRMVKVQYVGGFNPNQAGHIRAGYDEREYLRNSPFLSSYNKVPSTAGFIGGIENPHRFKGYKVNDNINPHEFEIDLTGTDTGTQGTYWTMEIPLDFHKPVIITDLVFYILVDGYYKYDNDFDEDGGSGGLIPAYNAGNQFQWGQTNFIPSDDHQWKWTNDIQIQLLVDNPYKPEDRKLSDVEVHKVDFAANSQLTVTPSFWGANAYEPEEYALGTNMLPEPPLYNGITSNLGSGKNGLCIEIKDKDICIPAKGRVRLSIMIPQYQTSAQITEDLPNYTGAPYGPISCNNFKYSWNVTALEEVEHK